MQPLSARCMHILLRFRMGAHNLLIVLGPGAGVLVPSTCASNSTSQHAVGDERRPPNALFCKVCGTVMLHCLLVVLAQCSITTDEHQWCCKCCQGLV